MTVLWLKSESLSLKMPKLKTLIVDDEVEAQNRLLLHLDNIENLALLPPESNGQEALKTIIKESPDLVFLDIEMPEMNGFELLANCPEPYPYIIFITAYDQYAVKAFEQNAIDYVLKPYAFKRIQQAVIKAQKTIEKDKLLEFGESFKDLLFAWSDHLNIASKKDYIKRIAIKSIGKTSFIPVDEIFCIRAADQYVEVYTQQEKFIVRESMDKLDMNLDPETFFRTHRSYIVNINYIVSLETLDKHNSIVKLSNHQEIKLASNRKPLFKQKMNL